MIAALPTSPCLNGGTCVDGRLPADVSCICADEFYGDHCEKRVDPCETVGADACQNGGTCVAGEGEAEFACDCPEGFGGDFCERLVVLVLETEEAVMETNATESVVVEPAVAAPVAEESEAAEPEEVEPAVAEPVAEES